MNAEDVAELVALSERWEADAKTLQGLAAKAGAYRMVVLEGSGHASHYARRFANIAKLSGERAG